jgi:hypothetical protein
LRRLCISLASVAVVALMTLPATSSAARPSSPQYRRHIPVHDERALSSGAKAWLYGAQHTGPDGVRRLSGPSFGTNVDPNDPTQDAAGGQSETAIGASGSNLVAAWNDATGFLASSDSTKREASLTGVGFSTDGGASFTDLIGLPNDNPNQGWFGDPTVVAIDSTHFVVGSLYLPSFFAPDFCSAHAALGLEVATITAGGVTFTNPIIPADGGPVCKGKSGFLDKEFLAYDPVSRTLALSYTDFRFSPPQHCGDGEINLVRATVPANPAQLKSTDFSDPIVVGPEIGGDCSFENFVIQEGAYPAVAPGGDIYVGWERNWETNLFNGDPYVYIDVALVRAGESAPARTVTASLGQANSSPEGGVHGLDAQIIAGYNRGIGNDFPRLAYNAAAARLDVVWNDTSHHPLGDIFLKSLRPTLGNNDKAPIFQVNDDDSFALHFLPALSVRSDGSICTSWYDRRLSGPDSPLTDYFGECRAVAGTNATDFRITTGDTDWTNTGSLIIPNFGDYTDNASSGTTTYYIWSDGRIGVPQPMVDSSH